jgi:FtsP/CotA-like multicopper oxidase with cupredoxin domain
MKRFGLVLFLLCLWCLPPLAGAAPLAPIPTGPLDAYNGIPDYYTTANWANSPPMAKFVDTLPGLTSAGKNNLNQYIPIAVPDTTTFPGSDYYIIKLTEYSEKMHSDLFPTKLRGYVQLDANGNQVDDPHYLGPIIVATKDRPVRIKFVNGLPTGAGGDLFIPVDETVMGAGEGPIPGNKYTQNRAAIHLHGGRTPWISDGTPHQWITPAGENTPYVKGVSLQNVPDMCFDSAGNAIPRATDPDCLNGSSDPGPGATTYYFTNQQSTRLMFYHDHAFGITRLNVYAGEAAGYLITDPIEQDLIDRGIIPGTKTNGTTSMGGMIPLIIQDKTFVDATPTIHPVTGQTVPKIRITDPLWNWGSQPKVNGVVPPMTGDLWMPHVYMPAQQPTNSSTGGVNPFGRWMYGPWFYPATAVVHGPVANPYYDPNCSSSNPFILAQCETPGQPPLIPGTPNVSMGMEAFQDSVVVNGTVFPTLTVDPKAYRFRILNAASDRFQNLSFYVADDTPANTSPDPRLTATGRSNKTEVKMATASVANALANNWPADWPVDGRDGGVPDPGICQPGGVNCTNLGPNFLQIGTEGGFLPAPTVRTPQPVTYITDPTAFWVGVVDKTGLALGPAERADVIVDFSAYAGKTLILYNDAPAAWPARVPGYDYYTGAPDLRDSGGYGTGGTWDPATGSWVGGTGPLPGYAPNTRTVMQVIVNNVTPVPFDATALQNLENEFTSAAPATALNPAPTKTLFERSQEPIIVGQAAYSSAYPNSYFPANFPWEGVNQINDHFLQFLTINGEEVKITTEPKGIHDEMGASFDPEYGRMSGNLAMQLPNPTTLNANLILYGFSDIPTEFVKNSTSIHVEVLPNPTPGMPGSVADGTQIWKISHNGVDTHPIHFHIFDVQLINRVGWDGQIAMPEANELGWKDTVKISPLMDTIVAVRPRAPALPFGIPGSIRPLNPAITIDSAMGFTNPTPGSDWPFFSNIDWTTGEAYVFNPGPPAFPYANYKGVVTNVLYDFGWEYVWHCHILSHEEMDMMRPIVLKVDTNLPPAFNAAAKPVNGTITVTWNDPTPVDYVNINSFGNPANEVGFNVYRSVNGGDFIRLNGLNLPANSTSFVDSSPVAGATYKVEAFNASGSTYTPATGTLAVNLTASEAPFTAPATVNLAVGVSGLPLGMSIVSVDFFNGTTLLGTATTAPFTFAWTNVMAGSYIVTAKVTDSQGAVMTASLPVTVDGVLTADFTISGSAAGADIGFCETITLTSTSTASSGSISGHSWSTGANTSTTTIPAGSLPGVYPVTLTISNTVGETAQVSKNITIVNHNPVAITGGPYTVTPINDLMLNGSASDPLDACNTSPFTYAWNLDNKGNNEIFTATATIPYKAILKFLGFGTHTINLTVTDSNGAVGTATTTISVYGLPPTVTLTAPANGSTYIAPASIALSATAAADTGATITGIDFYNGTTKIGTGVLSGGVYNYTWQINNGGSFNLKARATDSWGLFTDSTATTVSVSGISTVLLPDGVVNQVYNQPVTFHGGTEPFTWSATGLPAGLSIDPSTGVISGTPSPTNITVPALFANFPVSISVQDSSATPLTANVVLNLTINQTVPAAPTGLTATAPPVNNVVLTWTDNANNETGFRIERATDSTFTTGLTTFTSNTVDLTTFTDTTIVAGTTYYYRVRSFNNVNFSTNYSNTVMVALPVITTTSLPNGGVNVAYNKIISATGGIAPYTWSATGLPTSLSINPVTGIISGTPGNVVPANAGFATFPVTITLQDSVATTATTTLNLRINQTVPAAPTSLAATATAINQIQVALTWADMANNETKVNVQRATDAAFTTDFTSVVVLGAVDHTTYTDSTAVSGTTYYYRVRVANYVNWSAFSNTVSITTPTLPLINTSTLINGAVNVPYNQTITASSGIPPYTWSATGLPASLTVNPATGVISGTPGNVVPSSVAFATFPVTFTVQDSISSSTTTTLNLRINQTLPAAPSNLATTPAALTKVVLTWTDNANNESKVQIYRATDAAFTTGFTSFVVAGDTLTTYTDTTVVSGTTYYYKVRCANYLGWSPFSNTVTFTAPVLPQISTTTLVNGAANVPYNQTVVATAGVPPYTWSATGLPTGLSINPASGLISGSTAIPSNVAFADFPITITVQDSIASTATTTLNLRINQTLPAAPSNLAATAPAANKAVLTWNDNANNESKVQIHRATDAAFTTGFTSFVVVGDTLTTYTDNTVVSGTTYYYKVRAANYLGWSAFSNTTAVTTP